jgi:glutamate racemase
MNKAQPIGVFDSGIGGLSVLKQLIRFLPDEAYVYLGDTARVPYGNKSIETVKNYAKQCTEFLLNKNVKMIITACNTVSAVALEEVINTAGNTPVIGMIEPASEAALRQTVKGNVGIIGTRATINSDAYKKSIESKDIKNNVKIISKACPLFVPIVEEGIIRHPATRMIAEEYLSNLIKHNTDTLVLGCTHYPLMSDLFRELMPGINLIDSGEHAAVNALRILAENNLLKDNSENFSKRADVNFYVTDLPVLFDDVAKRFLGFDIKKPVIVSLPDKK